MAPAEVEMALGRAEDWTPPGFDRMAKNRAAATNTPRTAMPGISHAGRAGRSGGAGAAAGLGGESNWVGASTSSRRRSRVAAIAPKSWGRPAGCLAVQADTRSITG